VVSDRIEREIVIDAPPEIVWDVLTQPDHIKAWFADSVEIEVAPGGRGRFTWIQDTGPTNTVVVRVERADPPHYLSYRWNFPEGEEPHEGNAPLVEFSLTAEASGTRLRLVESGISGLERSEAEKSAYRDDHVRGWDSLLAKLVNYASRQRREPAEP
jgi:uncharacterized protein YndB with AHSA1/START domain